LGAPVVKGSALVAALTHKIDQLKKALERLSMIHSHDALVLLKNSLSMPKLLYLLRTADCSDNPLLTTFDNTPFGQRYLGALSPHFQSPSRKIWHKGTILGNLPHVKFGKKNSLKGYTPLREIVTKNTDFGDFWSCKPTFLKFKGLNLVLGCGPVTPSQCKIL